MTCPCDFEAKIQVNCVVELIGVVRSGDLLDKKADVLKHLGCVLGCAGAYVEQFNVRPAVGATDEVLPDTAEGCCEALETAFSAESIDGGADEGVRAINPAVMALILKLAEILIAKYL